MRARLEEVGINSYVKQLTTYNYKENKKNASPEHLQYSKPEKYLSLICSLPSQNVSEDLPLI